MFTGQHVRGGVCATLLALVSATGAAHPGRFPVTATVDRQAAAQAPPVASRVDSSRLLKDLATLAAPDMEGRLTGTPGNKRAQAYILEQFKQLKLQPLNKSFDQKFSFRSAAGASRTRRISSRRSRARLSPSATWW